MNLSDEDQARFVVLACNRAIEVVPADYWVWVDRLHYDRSRWHPNALQATWIGPSDSNPPSHVPVVLYEVGRRLPCPSSQLYLRGGTLTIAAHLAVRLGARTVAFLACDAWSSSRDRYHEWDGKPLDSEGIDLHRSHLESTADGIQDLVRQYPNVRFVDATQGKSSLRLPKVALEDFLVGTPKNKERKMAKRQTAPIPRDESVPMGYGKLISVTTLGSKDTVLWFEDTAGNIRAIRMAVDASKGLSLAMKGQAQIQRG